MDKVMHAATTIKLIYTYLEDSHLYSHVPTCKLRVITRIPLKPRQNPVQTGLGHPSQCNKVGYIIRHSIVMYTLGC